jgi:hypothetical protein
MGRLTRTDPGLQPLRDATLLLLLLLVLLSVRCGGPGGGVGYAPNSELRTISAPASLISSMAR